jgi:hypothetical protein
LVFDIKHRNKELVTQMRMARFNDNGNVDIDETSGNTFDSFDLTSPAQNVLYSSQSLMIALDL